MNKYHVTWYVQTKYSSYHGVEEVTAVTIEKAGDFVQHKIWRMQFSELPKKDIEIKQISKIKHYNL